MDKPIAARYSAGLKAPRSIAGRRRARIGARHAADDGKRSDRAAGLLDNPRLRAVARLHRPRQPAAGAPSGVRRRAPQLDLRPPPDLGGLGPRSPDRSVAPPVMAAPLGQGARD